MINFRSSRNFILFSNGLDQGSAVGRDQNGIPVPGLLLIYVQFFSNLLAVTYTNIRFKSESRDHEWIRFEDKNCIIKINQRHASALSRYLFTLLYSSELMWTIKAQLSKVNWSPKCQNPFG